VIRGVDPGATILLDCLTLWVGNLLHLQPDMDEDDIDRCAGELLATARNHQGTMVFVTNEVGMGIVPDNEMARRYRDLVGRCNQAIAAAADQVILVTCGMPITIKA